MTHSKNDIFNEIIAIFLEKKYLYYNFLISSFEQEDFAQIFNQFFHYLTSKIGHIIEKYEFDGIDVAVDEAKTIIEIVNKTNLNNYYKFIVICNIENLSQYTLNILLKTIEEPNSNAVFFFITSNIFSILPTIKSRCFQLNINHLETIYNNIIANEKDKPKQTVNQILERQRNKNIDLIYLINKEKLSQDEMNELEGYVIFEIFEQIKKSDNKHKLLDLMQLYEEKIKQIREFNCERRYLLNQILYAIKTK